MKVYRSILSVMFMLLVLVSSSSFMIGIHFCGGRVHDVALFSPAERCAMEKQLPPCHRHETAPCCNDEIVEHSAQDFNIDFAQVNIPLSAFVIIEHQAMLLAKIIPDQGSLSQPYFNYDPPIPDFDRTVTYGVLLI